VTVNRDTAVAGLTADDIASVWGVPKGTIYRYAHKYQWRRYTRTGRAYYHPSDVTATFDSLTPDQP
jgi:transposase